MKESFIVIANWKMNKTIVEAQSYAKDFPSLLGDLSVGVWLAVPFTTIRALREMFAATSIQIGAQNMHDATSGAFTGEIAASMLQEVGAQFVILGHSERRQYFHETDAFIHRKLMRAFEGSLQPVLCIGEGEEDRASGKTEDLLREQLTVAFENVPKEKALSTILAYEPVWAIGTGKTATPEIVKETHEMIRKIMGEIYSAAFAKKLSIVYGGSVSPATAEELAKIKGVNGFLVGTASLRPESFAKIAQLSDNVISASTRKRARS